MFYFEAQTGMICEKLPASPSNFYWYTLPDSALKMVEAAVSDAELTSSGFTYDRKFLELIGKLDMPANQGNPNEN